VKQKTEKAYQEWIEEQEAKLPQELRANFKTLVESPHGVEVFGGYMREQEFHRRLSELDTRQKALETDRISLDQGKEALANDVVKIQSWVKTEVPKFDSLKQQHSQLLKERDSLKHQLAEFGVEVAEPSHPGGPVRQANEDLRQEIAALRATQAAMDASLPAVLSDMATVLVRANKEGFEVDPRVIIDHATKQTNNLVQSYEMLTADDRRKREDERIKGEIEKARQEGAREALSKMHSPERLKPAGPSIFDTINAQPSNDRAGRVQGAIEAYNKMVAGA
jgi:hypothetical protein